MDCRSMDKEGFSCVFLWYFAIPCLTLLLIIDSVLFFGSIFQSKVILVIGMGFNAISILSFIGIVFLSISIAISPSNMNWESLGIAVTTLTIIGFVFKSWTFLTVIGALQEMMLEFEPDNSMNMSDL